MQTYDPLKPISGTTKLSQLYQIIRDHVNSLVSNFSGTSYPSGPVVGQHCFRTDQDIEYRYTASSGWAEVVSAGAGIGLEVVNARGSLGTMDQRLDVSMNEDGTLKAATSLNPSQWYTNTKASGVSSSTAFISYGSDMTAVYYPLRRLKVNRSGGTFFTEVVSSSYGGGNTTVNVRDAVIVATLYSVEHSIISPRKAAVGDGAVSYEMIADKQVALPSSTYTVLVGDSVILASGTFTITGINASVYGRGRTLIVSNVGSGTIIYDPYSTETVNGSSASLTLAPGQSLVIICDGSNWLRVDQPNNIQKNSVKVTSSSPYNITLTDRVVINNWSASTWNLPAASSFGAGNCLYLKNLDASDLTIDINGADTIDGSSTNPSIKTDRTLHLVSDGTNWKRLDKPHWEPGVSSPSLGSNWSASNPVSYVKDPLGNVQLRGLVLSGGSAAATIFTLNAGFRPVSTWISRTGHISASALPASLTINTDGTVVSNAGCRASGDMYYFDGIVFRAV